MYFGGYPGDHKFTEVTNINFDGCIDDVQISGTPVDLSQNVEAFGVKAGCPGKVIYRHLKETIPIYDSIHFFYNRYRISFLWVDLDLWLFLVLISKTTPKSL